MKANKALFTYCSSPTQKVGSTSPGTPGSDTTEYTEYITWQYQELNFGLLGGLKIEGLERMRVTLKVEYKQQAVRYNLDLYNNESLDKLVRRCAERFALGTTYLATTFATLINLLEEYRLEQLKKQAVEKETVKQLPESERKEAEKFLHNSDLFKLPMN